MSELYHYASKYYDPQKAHEYYERTKQLKGRKASAQKKTNPRPTSALNKEGKEVWKVTKDNIITEKKGKVTEAQTNRKNTIASHRASAAATRARITEKLKQLSEKLMTDQKKEIADIRGSSKSSAQKQAEIAKIRAKNQTERANNSVDAKTERANVAANLKSVITATRAAYAQTKTNLDTSYEKIYQQEFDKIKEEYASKKRSRK